MYLDVRLSLSSNFVKDGARICMCYNLCWAQVILHPPCRELLFSPLFRRIPIFRYQRQRGYGVGLGDRARLQPVRNAAAAGLWINLSRRRLPGAGLHSYRVLTKEKEELNIFSNKTNHATLMRHLCNFHQYLLLLERPRLFFPLHRRKEELHPHLLTSLEDGPAEQGTLRQGEASHRS